jgi:acylpyruvate hydrolase
MRLATLDIDGLSRAAVETSRGFVGLPFSNVGDLLNVPAWRSLVEHHLLDDVLVSVASATYLAVVPAPRKIICCGHNYRDHIIEMGRELPDFPTLFTKYADSLAAPSAELCFNGESHEIDWEAELAVVVGTEVKSCSPEEALTAIAGYTISNDISMRDWQRRTLQWFQGKAFDASTPLGPVLVTPDECDPKTGLAISCQVNGETVQSGNTASLVFDAAALISYISRFTVLRPGDVILTGTPGGVGMARTPPRFLADGDVLVTTIEGIGELRNPITIHD